MKISSNPVLMMVRWRSLIALDYHPLIMTLLGYMSTSGCDCMFSHIVIFFLQYWSVRDSYKEKY